MNSIAKAVLGLSMMILASTIGIYIAAVDNSLGHSLTQPSGFLNQGTVPVWETGDFWEYDIAINYDSAGTVADVVLHNVQFTVTENASIFYTLAFTGSVTGSAVIAGIVEGTIQNAAIDGSVTVRKSDLAIEAIYGVNIEGEIQRQLVTNDFSAELSLQQNVTPAVSPFDFPIILEETWSIPRVTLWLYLLAEIDLAVPFSQFYDFPVYIEERSASCVSIESVTVDAGTYHDVFHLVLEDPDADIWYSPSARNVLMASYVDVRMLYNESLYWDINELDVTLLDTNYLPGNSPPDTPSAPAPANNSENMSTEVVFQWSCTDPDGDPLTYDLFLGTESEPPLTASGLTNSQYASTPLTGNTTYFWRVNAYDDHNHSVAGPIWTFTTTTAANRPPNTPERPSGTSSGTVNTTYEYTSSAQDLDGDELYYRFNWGDGTTGEWLGPYASGQVVTATHSWQSTGAYGIKVQAKDEHGLESEWSEPLSVSMPLRHQTLLELIIEWILQLFGIAT